MEQIIEVSALAASIDAGLVSSSFFLWEYRTGTGGISLSLAFLDFEGAELASNILGSRLGSRCEPLLQRKPPVIVQYSPWMYRQAASGVPGAPKLVFGFKVLQLQRLNS